MAQTKGRPLLGEHDRLHARNLKALAAAHVLARHQIVFAQHVGSRLGKSGAVALVGSARKLALLGSHHPGDFVLRRLVAVRAVQCRRLLFLPLVKKIALFHGVRLSSAGSELRPRRQFAPQTSIITVLSETSYGNMKKRQVPNHATKEKTQTFSGRDRSERAGPRARRRPAGRPDCGRKKEKAGEAQAHAGQVAE